MKKTKKTVKRKGRGKKTKDKMGDGADIHYTDKFLLEGTNRCSMSSRTLQQAAWPGLAWLQQ
jgi:hypothetical protein